jgi:hypothetical protein
MLGTWVAIPPESLAGLWPVVPELAIASVPFSPHPAGFFRASRFACPQNWESTHEIRPSRSASMRSNSLHIRSGSLPMTAPTESENCDVHHQVHGHADGCDARRRNLLSV